MIIRKSLATCLWIVVLFALVSACSNTTDNSELTEGVSPPEVSQHEPAGPSTENVVQHCTVIYAADDNVALGGNNEDNYYAPLTHIWFIPPEEGRYGMALVGYDNFLNPEGAVNDHGLFYDALSVRDVEVPPKEGAPRYDGSPMMEIMTECATVDCALAFYEKYSMAGHWNGQLFLGDRYGNSAIIEPLAIVRKEGSFQVATNFFQSEVPPAYRTDTRYVEATSMLRNADHFSVDLLRNTLDVVYQQYDGDAVNLPLHTQYSTIYDLKRGLIYLYYFHDFEHAATFDLKQELAKGIHAYEISSLFSSSPAAQEIGGKNPLDLEDLRLSLRKTTVDPELVSQYAGKYQIEALKPYLDSKIYVKSENDRLFIRNPWMPWVEGIPQTNTDFTYLYSDPAGSLHQLTFSFMEDASSQVTKMELAMDGSEKIAANKLPPDLTQEIGLVIFFILALALGVFGAITVLRNTG